MSLAALRRAGVAERALREAGGTADGGLRILGPYEQGDVRCWALAFDEPDGGFAAVARRWAQPGMPEAVVDAAERLVERLRPALVHVHGTEGPLGLIALRRRRDDRIVVSLQGIVSAWQTVVFAGMGPLDRLRLALDPQTAKGWGVLHDRRALRRAARREQQIMRSGALFLGRTDWDEAMLHAVAPGARYAHCDELLAGPFWHVCGRSVASGEREGGDDRIATGPAAAGDSGAGDSGAARADDRRADGALPPTLFSTSSDLPGKGTECLLEAVGLLSRRRRVRVRVAGVSPGSQLDAFYRRRARAAGVADRVTWLGRLDAASLAQELAAADVFAYPSHGDNSPNSLCEAMLVGVPCVATRVGGIPSLLADGEEGLLVPDGDARALAVALERLLDDGRAAAQMAAAARARARRRHDRDRVVAQLAAAYHRLLGNPSESPQRGSTS